MKLLLDTHAFIFFVNGDEQLSDKAKNAILERDNIKFLSVACVWEIAIKISLGKLQLTQPIDFIPDLIEQNGFILQEIEMQDTLLVAKLPFLHRDPFDRLLVAQATNNNFTIVTRDSFISDYSVQTLW